MSITGSGCMKVQCCVRSCLLACYKTVSSTAAVKAVVRMLCKTRCQKAVAAVLMHITFIIPSRGEHK